ncbi:hypothetical protein MPDQ_001769 [Monascus purpureus]|uniref:Uncharacterized protein n=1 Tax=Monascus purpureus TaxID=5098 RepID=A0A507R0W9_MONPU|nr:hypothetical protein MPDQ_001769 [Monascus purpureus]BDD59650.1 hypothetical protein MAP00_004845 [Monascus purpureus]
MAQNAVGRLFRSGNTSTLRQPIVTFTQSRSYSKHAIPTFSQTSSPELDQALNHFREELFIPFGLNVQQRKLMFRQRYSRRLKEDPVRVSIGENDEQFTLRPMNLLERPKTKEIANIVSLMKTKSDWNNIIPFLSGLRMSHRSLSSGRWQWLIRKAGEADALGIILECAKQSERTGLRLNTTELVQPLFFQIHRMAQVAEFKDPAVSKALGLAKQFVELMETPEHIEHDMSWDPKRKPFVIGVFLELNAARALNESGGNDETGDVLAYARRLSASWDRGNFSTYSKDWYQADELLRENLPIFNGLKLALEVNGIDLQMSVKSSLESNLEQVRKQIAALMEMAPEKVKEKPTLGYQQAQLLFK